MAFKIVWSRQAREDLLEIVSFIAQDNQALAESFGYLLMSKVDSLSEFPKLGRVVPELQDQDVRELIFRSYRIIYRVVEPQRFVAIARVWHAARGAPEVPETES